MYIHTYIYIYHQGQWRFLPLQVPAEDDLETTSHVAILVLFLESAHLHLKSPCVS